ncbi:hypothetical protein GBA65_06840 [Rubrobacter marinus]|uniref:Flippase-like domain-containing protein n=1 Tax=Rubrobacter marinus TaxID=2653852 RepID=A0A6G8PVR1_9ACTN|nr:hypothetical protein GBA65_06840 [Rubrobacter marinus]
MGRSRSRWSCSWPWSCPSSTSSSAPLQSLKRNLVLALGLSVAVYLAIAVLSDLGELVEAFRRFDWLLAPVILGLVALSYAGRFVRWAYYLRVLGISLPLGQNAAIFAAGLSMTVSPGKLGEVLKSVFMRRAAGTPVARSAPAVVAERVTDGTGMILWGLLGALTFDFGLQALIAFSIAMVGAVAVFRSKKLSLLAERVMSRLPLLKRLAPHLSEFHGPPTSFWGCARSSSRRSSRFSRGGLRS